MLNIDIEDEYKPMVNDLIKFLILFIVVNILMFITNPKSGRLFSESYIKIMTFSVSPFRFSFTEIFGFKTSNLGLGKILYFTLSSFFL